VTIYTKHTQQMKKFISSMFTDERNTVSVKRVIGFMCALFLCVTMALNSYSHESIKPADTLVDAVLSMGIACIAGTSVDKFSAIVTGKKDEPKPTE
jgi:hypothetical protein